MSKIQSLIEIFNQNGLHGEEAVQKATATVNEEREERERERVCELVYSFFHPGLIL